MQRIFAVALACLCLAACTTTSAKLASDLPSKPPSGARILLVQPDVQLAVLTAGGVNEARADWSKSAQDNLGAALHAQLAGRSHALTMVDPQTLMSGRPGQVIRLNQAVVQSIQIDSVLRLPTKAGGFNWTLGDGAAALAQNQPADYALFIHAQGNYASGGRVATSIGMAMLGVSVPLGQQTIYASLVDLRSGRIVWFASQLAGSGVDMRQPAGASSLMADLLKNIPL